MPVKTTKNPGARPENVVESRMPTSGRPWSSARRAICTALARPFAFGTEASTSVYPSATFHRVSVVVPGAVGAGVVAVTAGRTVVTAVSVPNTGSVATVVRAGSLVATTVFV